MPDIGNVITEDQLTKLRGSYASDRAKKDKSDMSSILRGVLPSLYTESGSYVGAIVDTYFEDQSDREALHKFELNESDRERCIIALLSSQGGQFTLALHIYLALMLEVSPQEISHILLLSGVYTGVNRFAEGMFVHVKTLQTLQGIQGDTGPMAANKALRVAFGIDPAPKPDAPAA